MRTIRLAADYQCYPLWKASPGEVGNIAPADLPISAELCEKLMLWAGKFDRTLNMNDPARSGFSSYEAAEEFRSDGLKLAEHLQAELGAEYSIVLGKHLSSISKRPGAN